MRSYKSYRPFLFGGLLLAFVSCSIFEQKQMKGTNVRLADSYKTELYKDSTTIEFEEGFFENISEGIEQVDLDELYASFENTPDESLPIFSNEQTEAQVNAMSGAVNISYNSEIQEYINRFTSKKGRKYISKMLALSQLYFPVFEKILEEEGVPEELKYAAVVESALIPNIMSRAGAVGLWQFMYFTGKKYGMKIGGNVDQRCDIFTSTRAAARYMRDLYQLYGDWLMVLAAYNCGPGNVNKAIIRSGGGTDFWSIYKYLPQETRRHIPKYIATFYAFHYHKDLMIAPMRDMVKYKDIAVVKVNKPIHLEQVAKVLDLEEKDLAELNRVYLKGYIPANKEPYKLVLPAEKSDMFVALKDSIYNYNRSEFFSKTGKLLAKKKDFYPSYGVYGAGTRTTYVVRKGDVLGRIAKRHGTTVKNIKKWNGLHSDRIRIGQKLIVYVSGKTIAEQPKKKIEKQNNKVDKKNVELPYLPDKYIYHTVKKDENCWSIAQQYEGVTQDSIMEMNQITDPGALRIGQRLRIKERG